MRGFTIALLALFLLVPAAHAASMAGTWRGEHADCGDHTCTTQEVEIGAFHRLTLAVKLRVSGTRVCGEYQALGPMRASRLLAGEIRGGKVYAVAGQETSSDPAFFQRDDYAQVPAFERRQLLVFTSLGAHLRVQQVGDRRGAVAQPPWTLARATAREQGDMFSPALPWETQFFTACLAHRDPAIEAAVRDLRESDYAPQKP